MTDNELRHLSRRALLELLMEQGARLEASEQALRAAQAALRDRQITLEEAGSIAAAALELNGVFEAAQAAGQQYIESIQTLRKRQDAVCAQRDEESRAQAERRLEETARQCAELEKESQRRCEEAERKSRHICQALEEESQRKCRAMEEETSRQCQERVEETDRQCQERLEEAGRQCQEQLEETRRQCQKQLEETRRQCQEQLEETRRQCQEQMEESRRLREALEAWSHQAAPGSAETALSPETAEQETPPDPGQASSGTLPTLRQLDAELERVTVRRRCVRRVITAAAVVAVVTALAVLVSTLLLPVLRIYGTSMEPTLTNGQVVVAYAAGSVDRGDIVAFHYNNEILVKRVIGLPGEWIDIDDKGNVSIEGVPLEEPYLTETTLGDCGIELPYQIPEGRYFVMGDHRSVSSDSRNPAIGCVSEEQIIGELAIRIWPLSGLGTVK